MATYTDNYHLSKPETTDSQQSFMEDYATNMDIIDENMGGGSGGGGHVIIDENGIEVAQEPNMQFTGKVEVTDDSTNEKTVVEVLPEVVEVTLAEYIALGDVVNTDGKLYCITDLNNSDVQGYPPLIYSDEEREVGVWIDGRPLYQITINIGQLTLDTNFHVISHNISNIDEVVDIKAIMMLENSPYRSYPLPIGRPNTSPNQNVLISVNSTEIQYMNNWQSNTHVVYVTFQYTKTTDTAGSGIWNGQGGYAHHYSTSEKVIGTWIDGKPLYEKTIVYDCADNSNVQTAYSIPSTHFIVTVCDAYFQNSTGGLSQQLRYTWYKDHFWSYIVNNSGHVISIHRETADGNWQSGVKFFIIIQYTKTTD